ncbi:hypothetical protein [Streptomyces rubiginosohelvolus]
MTAPLPWAARSSRTVADTDPDGLWTRDLQEPRVPADTYSWLSALRRTAVVKQTAAATANGRQLAVATYVVGPSADEERLHRPLAEYATEQGWRVGRRSFTDESVGAATAIESGFHGACIYAASGFVHGVLTAGRFMITPDAAAYEAILRWLDDRGAFLDYLPATRLKPAARTRPAWYDRAPTETRPL